MSGNIYILILNRRPCINIETSTDQKYPKKSLKVSDRDNFQNIFGL